MNVGSAIVVPHYNEEEMFPETNRRLLDLLMRLQAFGLTSVESLIHSVEHGSRDCTWPLIESPAQGFSACVGEQA